jgi:RND superfamily putative drug exporter
VIAVVFAGIFVVLAALLRSALTPVKLFVSLLMGIVWTLAAFTIVFQYWLGMAVIWILPITLFCTLMGLGGDYVVFMMSRVREEIGKGASDEDAILTAVEVTGPVILLCGLVMAAAFGSMMISDMAELREFGFVLSLAIILDATLMVLVLIPSIMMVARKYNWWLPSKGAGRTRKQ